LRRCVSDARRETRHHLILVDLKAVRESQVVVAALQNPSSISQLELLDLVPFLGRVQRLLARRDDPASRSMQICGDLVRLKLHPVQEILQLYPHLHATSRRLRCWKPSTCG
jgi:hypothetical protein